MRPSILTVTSPREASNGAAGEAVVAEAATAAAGAARGAGAAGTLDAPRLENRPPVLGSSVCCNVWLSMPACPVHPVVCTGTGIALH